MQLWQDGLVAMLAAIGLASLMWTVVRAVAFSRPERKQGAFVIIPAQGDGENLEQQVHQLSHLRYEQGLVGMILLVDCGLSGEGRKLAELLAREDRWVSVCGKDEIGSYLAL